MRHENFGVESSIIRREGFENQAFWGIKIYENPALKPGASTSTKKHTCFKEALTSKGTTVTYHTIGNPSKVCASCSAAVWYDERTNKGKNSRNPTFSICCQEGKVQLPNLKEPPEPLKELLGNLNDSASSKFREQIRIYNSVFSFTSMGAKIDNAINRGAGPYTFRISGQNYHQIGSLVPPNGKRPRFAQLYFYDTQNELRNRMTSFMKDDGKALDESIVQGLMEMLDTSSSVTKAFRMARDWCVVHKSEELSLRLTGKRNTDSRQYNTPHASEVAALILGDFGQNCEGRDIVVQSKTEELQRISELHPLYMALQYPLLFPYGEDGYHENIPYARNIGNRQTSRDCVTMREFYAYRVQQRCGGKSAFIRGGRLLQQYIVDAYSAIEEQRLKYIRHNQDDLRSDIYKNVCDAVVRGDTKASSIGKRIVLPSTFTGSPRYMVQNYQDAMAMCRVLGNPDLFITFTANPKWPEIRDMLLEVDGQKPADRPDIVSRVFKIKLDYLMKDLNKNGIFGECRAVVYTIEFQKRGLPHAHILLWLSSADKCKTPAAVDDIISAEIPSPSDDPQGYKAVFDFMLHGPCGDDNRNAPCMTDGKCAKHFPKKYYMETTIDEDGFPIYRRRNNGIHVKKAGAKLDNRFVTPHNRYLLIKYQAHINVEWCNQSKAIKYLFKYLSKGPDRTTIVIQENIISEGETRAEKTVSVDEIKQFLDCRYLSACEAVWRTFAFDIHHCNPTVMRLSFHLEDENLITMHDSDRLDNVVKRKDLKKTTFTAWFELNRIDIQARMMTYAEIPTKYVWHAKLKEWKPRKQGKCIGRIYYAHPTSGERYYLRMLLNVVKGPTSYKDIRTVKGKQEKSFKETCYALGMLTDDREWSDAISEASTWAVGAQLRQLFTTLLLFCEVSDPKKLWEDNWEVLAEDILYKKRKEFNQASLKLNENQIRNYCLLEIQDMLNANGKSLTDYQGLPMPDIALLPKLSNRLIREELEYDKNELHIEHARLFSSMNNKQLEIYNEIISTVHDKKGGFFFVYGAGGTGKTFLYRAIISKLRSEGLIVLAVASSGIASLLLPGGRTAHSRFVIPVELMENSTCGITQNTHLAALMHEVNLIIWDEAPMTQKYAFEALDRTLRDILSHREEGKKKQIFGGLPILLGGDFRQILPVIPKGKRADIIQSCINKSVLWNECKVFTLSRSMRVNALSEDGVVDVQKQKFNEWILGIGDGDVIAKARKGEDEPTWIEIPSDFLLQGRGPAMEQIVNAIYPDFNQKLRSDDYLNERAILAPLNHQADEINEYMFNKLQGLITEYKSSDEICLGSTDIGQQHQMYPVEFLNSLNFPNMPPHMLQLREGLPVMLLRNVNPSEGLCNGTRMVISSLGKWIIRVRIITGSAKGREAFIPRITLTSPKTKWPFIMKRRQFPIKACYAMTINKSQGQSLKIVGLILTKPVFCHGQLYVALSRVTDPRGLKILIQQEDSELKNHTRNIVFKEIFYNLTSTTEEQNIPGSSEQTSIIRNE